MFKRFSIFGALAFLAMAGTTQAQTVNCDLNSPSYVNGVCNVTGVLDADGFTVNVYGMVGSSSQPSTYIIQTAPSILNGQNADTKITGAAGNLLADDELGSGFDRIVCVVGGPTPNCPTSFKVMPYGTPDNQTVKVFVNRLNN
jgi:hypothetical protein